MIERTKSNREVFAYVRFLLDERTEQLRVLERTPSDRSDYPACRRSLEQAINELKALLRAGQEVERS